MWEQHSILGRWGVGGGIVSIKKKDRPLIINSNPASPLYCAIARIIQISYLLLRMENCLDLWPDS